MKVSSNSSMSSPLLKSTVALIRHAVTALRLEAGIFDHIQPSSRKSIGVFLPQFAVDDYLSRVLSGMATVLEGSEYQATFHILTMDVNPDDAENYYRALFAVGAAESSFIIAYTSPGSNALIPFCDRYQRPYLLMDHDIAEDTGSSPAICIDNRQATLNAMHYLFSLGHRRIGFITGLMSVPSACYRLQGYKDALQEAHLPFDPDLVGVGNWQIHDSVAATEHLLALNRRPTAIIASNDEMAISAMSVILGAGLNIPRDISLVGFDDLAVASYTQPTLSTVRQPMMRMGQKAINVAIALAEGKILAEPKMRFTTELIIRDSTGLVPK